MHQPCQRAVMARKQRGSMPPARARAPSQAAVGLHHVVLLRSDGAAVACGRGEQGQCDLPAPEAGTAYTQVAAGGGHTVLLRSDGRVAACGDDSVGRSQAKP